MMVRDAPEGVIYQFLANFFVPKRTFMCLRLSMSKGLNALCSLCKTFDVIELCW